jgi:uncharacterized protein (DUF305 family)
MRKPFSPLQIAGLALGLAAFPLAASWADTTTTMSHDMAAMDGPATAEYSAVMNTMMTDMMVTYTGDADVDFIRGMIPHHQGAVDNAKIVLKYGQDPEVRKFAMGVIAAQEAEIKWMNDWLAKHAK